MDFEQALLESFSLGMNDMQASFRETAMRYGGGHGASDRSWRPADLGLDALATFDAAAGMVRSEFPAVIVGEELGSANPERALQLMLPLPALWLLKAAGMEESFDWCLAAWMAGEPGPGLGILRAGSCWHMHEPGCRAVVLLKDSAEGPRIGLRPLGSTAQAGSPALVEGRVLLEFEDDAAPAADFGTLVDFAMVASVCRDAVHLLSAILTGAMRSAIEAAFDYADQRKSFGKPIFNHQAVAIRLADMQIAFQGLELLLHRAASDTAVSPAISASMIARQTAAASRTIFRDALQVFAAHGYIADSQAGRLYRTANAMVALIDAVAKFDRKATQFQPKGVN